MSRSNPTISNPHPAARWIEWNGAKGTLRYFDKEINNAKSPEKKGDNVTINQPFAFLVLEETSCVRGWHKASKSNITSNEVRDTREQPLLVKSFKGGPIANGLYAAIKDRCVAAGGYFQDNVYIATKTPENTLQLDILQLNGAAVRAWMDFRKKHGKKVYEGAVFINGFTSASNGDIEYCIPIFGLKEVKPETDEAARRLDAEVVQPYLTEYFKKGVSHGAEQATTGAAAETPENSEGTTQEPPDRVYRDEDTTAPPEDDDIPF